MSKTLQTKEKILNLIKNTPMTVTQLSETLGLSTATVSQHMQELKQMGAVESVDNSYFKKTKYYKLKPGSQIYAISNTSHQYIKIIPIVVAVLLGVVFVGFWANSSNVGTSTSTNAITNQAITPTIPGSATCPNFPAVYGRYNVSIIGDTGLEKYNASGYADYVIAPGSNGMITLRVTKLTNGTNSSVALSNNMQLYYTANVILYLQSSKLPNITASNSSVSSVTTNKLQATYFSTETNTSITEYLPTDQMPPKTIVQYVTSSYASGVSYAAIPANETMRAGQSTLVNITITASSDAMLGTYFASLYMCRVFPSPSFLLTVGNKPYTGQIRPQPLPPMP